MLSVLGQFVRWGIVMKIICIRNGSKEGAVFDALGNELLVQTFIEYFRIRVSAGTVNAKTDHLRTAIRSAVTRSSSDILRQEKLNRVYLYLQKCGNAAKKLSRNFSTMKRISGSREQDGKMLQPDDFTTLILHARQRLDGILANMNLNDSSDSCSAPTQQFINNSSLLRKWSINMLALTMLLPGGQRPQVFTQMQCPTNHQLQLWQSSSFKSSYVEIGVKIEKRARATDLPNIVIPKIVVKYLTFHLLHARPAIMTR